ncbi:hypothetical protein PSEUDO9AZ_40838 [Pseudomonas sp. 9AZ]|uniref:TetR/AcrR family transcriptional regulator n=1 Tax=Pseudomonas sp. 9AZ TaxID=2653168 RepID=UPI0012F346E3|nr:helix-turn-helix domain-containing protein [Pseudomonas sp. 9AZ]VXD04185.1 hypothetical protein PSEUDO9AZ_40838 [Pseudomonas sp. 9AZ]
MAVRSKTTQRGEEMRALIFDAAEEMFLAKGFDTATQREIAEAAGIEQGLLTYYFKTKKELFEKALERRLQATFNLQHAALQTLLKKTGGKPVVEDVLQAYSNPVLNAVLKGDRGILFAVQLTQIRLPSNTDSELLTAAEALYAPLRKAFVDALVAALPHASRKRLDMGFDAFEAIYFALFTDRRGGIDMPLWQSTPASRKFIVNFGAAGIRGMATPR